MPYISDNWPDVTASLHCLEQSDAERVTGMVASLEPLFKDVERLASSVHPINAPCRIISDRYTWGQSFVVFEIAFDFIPTSWIVRFGLPPIDAFFNTAAQLERKILNEVAALHVVRQKTTIPVPAILLYHPVKSPSNPLGPEAPPFVLMTAMTGMTVDELGVSTGSGEDPIRGDESKRPILERYLSDIADIHVQLSKVTFDCIGSFVLGEDGNVTIGPGADYGLGPFTSAKQYFNLHADAYDELAAAHSTDTKDGRLKRQFVSSLWRAAIMPLLDARDDAGPFPMRHGDLHDDNILVDSTGHIVGVLDWDCAGTVPWEAFAVPTFEVSGHFTDVDGRSREERLCVHDAFNRALVRAGENKLNIPSGRTLAELHNSYAGHVGAYLAYWMNVLSCDYEHTGRALHKILGWDGDIESAFQKFVDVQQTLEDKIM